MEQVLYFAKIIETKKKEYTSETLWYGGGTEALASMLKECMDAWYKPTKKTSKKITDFYKKLERAPKLRLEDFNGLAFDADGRRLKVELTSSPAKVAEFVKEEICLIYGNGEKKPSDFASDEEFLKYFYETYKDFKEIFGRAVYTKDPMDLTGALFNIDIDFNFNERHYKRLDK